MAIKYSIMSAYVYVYKSEMNDSNDTQDGKKELGLFCYYIYQ